LPRLEVFESRQPKEEDLDQATSISSFENIGAAGMQEREDPVAYGGYLNISSIQIAQF
jgi:hypothetical protein